MIIRRKSNRPEAALRWLAENGLSDVKSENLLEVRNEGNTAIITLDGSIGKSWWDDSGITAKEVTDAINAVPAGKKIKLRVNSEGGSVKEGLGIYDSIEARKSDITCRITGYALSIASVFPLAAGRIESPDHAIWMSHEAWMSASGNKRDMRKNADMLQTHDGALAKLYAKRTGKSEAYWAAKMEAETWFTGSEAVSEGLADDGGAEDEAKADANISVRPIFAEYAARCKNVPAHILNALTPRKESGAPLNTAAPQPAGNTTPNPQESTMNKKVIVALLLTHGIKDSTGKEFTEQTPDAEFETGLNALATKKDLLAEDRFKAIEAKLDLAETKRITDKVLTHVEAGRITNDEAAIWVAAARTDEKGTLAILDAKPSALEAGFAVSASGRIELGETRRESASNAVQRFEPVARIIESHKALPKLSKNGGISRDEAVFNEVLANWDAIYAQALKQDVRRGITPMNANSITGFTTAFLLSGSLTPLQNVWAPLMAFSKDYSPDPYKPLATPTLKNPTAASSTLTDATNFAQGNSTVGALTATMHQYTQPFQISNTDLNSGLRMEDLVTINRGAFANKIIDVALAPVTAANFTATPVISAPAAFGFSDSAYLQGQLQKADIVNLILDGTYLASLSNTPGFFQQAGTVFGSNTAWQAFGWNMICKNSRWTGAGNNIKGFACNPQALIGIMGLPLTPPNIGQGGIFNVETVTIPGLNISVAIYTWWDVNARTMWTSFDVMAGFALGDATAGILVASGTPS